MFRLKITITILLLAIPVVANAEPQSLAGSETPAPNRTYSLSIGLNLGGTMPFPLPAAIIKIKSYEPFFYPTAKFETMQKSGFYGNIALLNKGMSTAAQVKEWGMNFENFHGKFSGTVDTKMNATYVRGALGKYFLSFENFSPYLGIYADVLLAGTFNGAARDGTLNSSGSKVNITDPQKYDFSESLNRFDGGLTIGIKSPFFRKRCFLSFELNYSFTSTFERNFSGISYEMQNIYANLSIGYTLPN